MKDDNGIEVFLSDLLFVFPFFAQWNFVFFTQLNLFQPIADPVIRRLGLGG